MENIVEQSNTGHFAQRELDILLKTASLDEDDITIKPFIGEIIALANKFGLSGQSGGSAPMVAGYVSWVVKKLLLQEPICPISGIDEEWIEVAADEGKPLFQNSRCSALFKVGKDGRAYYLDAIVFKGEGEHNTFTGTAWDKDHNTVWSRQYVRFPFVPKTFYLDIYDQEVAENEVEHFVQDHSQLHRAYKYYDKYELNG